MPELGKCRLCLEEKELQESHFVPRALYPTNRTIYYATQNTAGRDPLEMKDYVFCRKCEGVFNEGGESDVLRLVAPKLGSKGFPLLEHLSGLEPRCKAEGLAIYSDLDVGIDTSKFAYFALSLVWKAAVHQWRLLDGSRSKPLDLKSQEEPIRRFLHGETAFPEEIAVLMTVCTDTFSREHWIQPMFAVDPFSGCDTFSLLIMGIIFRIFCGPNIPKDRRETCCCSSQFKIIFSAPCEDPTREVLENAVPMRQS